jgi:tetratricopeptide (TPR) repeat protein
MAQEQVYSLDAVRTDGWFERIGETIGSFQALCDILGRHFFAFAMITGARITALTVDRRVPDNTVVDYTVGDEGAEVQSITLGEFRRRLVGALVQEEPPSAAPASEADVEGMQRHIGVRYLLLAPLFGYQLRRLHVGPDGSRLEVLHDGVDESYQLSAFRARLRTHVRQEHDRLQRGQGQGAIDLSRVAEAERASASGEFPRVVELLGAWPAPLSIFLRTPEGQMLGAEARATVARGLSLLGSACVELGEYARAEEILRLAVQYAGEGRESADVYLRLGVALLADSRPGEAIGLLRRAAALGAAAERVWPALGRAFLARERYLAALATTLAAAEAGVPLEHTWQLRRDVAARLGEGYAAWASYTGESEQTEVTGPPPSGR